MKTDIKSDASLEFDMTSLDSLPWCLTIELWGQWLYLLREADCTQRLPKFAVNLKVLEIDAVQQRWRLQGQRNSASAADARNIPETGRSI